MSSFLLISSCNYIANTKGLGACGEGQNITRSQNTLPSLRLPGEGRSVALHLFLHTVRQFLDLFGFLDDFQRKRVFA